MKPTQCGVAVGRFGGVTLPPFVLVFARAKLEDQTMRHWRFVRLPVTRLTAVCTTVAV
jgi:hypothetical protein